MQPSNQKALHSTADILLLVGNQIKRTSPYTIAPNAYEVSKEVVIKKTHLHGYFETKFRRDGSKILSNILENYVMKFHLQMRRKDGRK